MSPTDMFHVKVAPLKSPSTAGNSSSGNSAAQKPGAAATPPLLHIPSSVMSPTESGTKKQMRMSIVQELHAPSVQKAAGVSLLLQQRRLAQHPWLFCPMAGCRWHSCTASAGHWGVPLAGRTAGQ
jgi:hypothetical protein